MSSRTDRWVSHIWTSRSTVSWWFSGRVEGCVEPIANLKRTWLFTVKAIISNGSTWRMNVYSLLYNPLCLDKVVSNYITCQAKGYTHYIFRVCTMHNTLTFINMPDLYEICNWLVVWAGLVFYWSRWAPPPVPTGLHLLLKSDGGNTGPPKREWLPVRHRGHQPVLADHLYPEAPQVWWWVGLKQAC